MARIGMLLSVAVVLAYLPSLAGCDKRAEAERQKAVVEAEKAKAELAKLRSRLRQAQAERDELKNTLTETLEKLADAKLELTSADQAQQKSWDQVAEVAEQRDMAIETAEKTLVKIKEMSQQINELQQHNRELEATLLQTQNELEQCNRLLIGEGELAPETEINEPAEEESESLEQPTEDEQLQEVEEPIDSEL
jgi:septal ring factor EnvC (AmiA/AmiB activator)